MSYAQMYKDKLNEKKGVKIVVKNIEKTKDEVNKGVNFDLLSDWETVKKPLNEEKKNDGFESNFGRFDLLHQNLEDFGLGQPSSLSPHPNPVVTNTSTTGPTNKSAPPKKQFSLLNKFSKPPTKNLMSNAVKKSFQAPIPIKQPIQEEEKENISNKSIKSMNDDEKPLINDKSLNSLRVNDTKEVNLEYSSYQPVPISSSINEIQSKINNYNNNNATPNTINVNQNSNLILDQSKPSISIPKIQRKCSFDESELRISPEDSLNVTQDQMNDLNNEVNSVFRSMNKENKKKATKEENMKQLLLKQKNIVQNMKKKNESLRQSRNSRNSSTPKPIPTNPVILPKIQTQKRVITYKPKTIKEYKEKYENKKNRLNSINKLPAGLGPNIGTSEWMEKHQRAIKRMEYGKVVEKTQETKAAKRSRKNEEQLMKDMLNDSINKDINEDTYQSLSRQQEVKKTSSAIRRPSGGKKKMFLKKVESEPQTLSNTPKKKVYTTLKVIPRKKLPPIPKQGSDDEMTKMFMNMRVGGEAEPMPYVNPELDTLLNNHRIYNSKVQKIKESLYRNL